MGISMGPESTVVSLHHSGRAMTRETSKILFFFPKLKSVHPEENCRNHLQLLLDGGVHLSRKLR